MDRSQVIDITCDIDLKISPKNGGHIRKGYTLDAAFQLIPFLREIGTAKLAGAPDVLQQAFAWAQAVSVTATVLIGRITPYYSENPENPTG